MTDISSIRDKIVGDQIESLNMSFSKFNDWYVTLSPSEKYKFAHIMLISANSILAEEFEKTLEKVL